MSSGNPRQDPVSVTGHSFASWVTGRDCGPSLIQTSGYSLQVCVNATVDVLSEGRLSPPPHPMCDVTHAGPHILCNLKWW